MREDRKKSIAIRNRVVDHLRIRAGDLVPHEKNPRTHSEEQRETLAAMYREVGFARSLLAYRLRDGRLKLIDGHLRQSMDPDMVVDVEVLDVTDAEADKLLLSLDPLAALAGFDEEKVAALADVVNTDEDALANLWATIRAASKKTAAVVEEAERQTRTPRLEEVWQVLIDCRDHAHQIEVLREVKGLGMKAKALIA